MVGEYMQTGQETLMELMSQRERLKGVQRHVFDMLNYLGVSNSVLKTVERREVLDRIIVFGGMLIVSLLVLAVWWFRKRR
jgi:Golgi SNAP receptor complex protein 2